MALPSKIALGIVIGLLSLSLIKGAFDLGVAMIYQAKMKEIVENDFLAVPSQSKTIVVPPPAALAPAPVRPAKPVANQPEISRPTSDFDAFYEVPPKCESLGFGELDVDCVNHRIRAKRAFENQHR